MIAHGFDGSCKHRNVQLKNLNASFLSQIFIGSLEMNISKFSLDGKLIFNYFQYYTTVIMLPDGKVSFQSKVSDDLIIYEGQ